MNHRAVVQAWLGALLLLAGPVAAPGPAPDASRVAVVWWPAHPQDDATSHMQADIEGCLASRIRELAPGVEFVAQRTVRDALYPLLEPATQPASETEFAALLAREDVRERLARHGVRHLVAFSGGTVQAEPGGFILCGAGYGGGGCLGLSWQGETTRLDAAVWTLDNGARVQKPETVQREGASVVAAFLLPVPIPARTQASACREMGTRIGRLVRETVTADAPDK